MRRVVDGERLSGYPTSENGNFPEIHVYDRPKGSMLFTIGAFVSAAVEVNTAGTVILRFSGEAGTAGELAKTAVRIENGVVEYSEGISDPIAHTGSFRHRALKFLP